MRERILSVLLIVLLVAILAVQNSPVSDFTAKAPPIPNMFIHPAEITNSSAVAGQNFRISINITNVEYLFGWQANITFNKAVVNCTSPLNIVRSSWFDNKFGGPAYTRFVRSIHWEDGYILVSCVKNLPYTGLGASGNGTLAYITFTVIANDRATLLAFGANTYLRTAAAPDLITPIEPFTAQDGSFDNRPSLVNLAPTADFNYMPLGTGANSEGIEFNPSASSDPDAWIERYHWDYGDGTTELCVYNRTALISEGVLHRLNWTTQIVHVYEQAGTYTITLTVTDNNGATATFDREFVLLHDIAIKDVKAGYVAVMAGIQVPMNVNISNNGNFTETFDINAYFNETFIETGNIMDMPHHTETTLTLSLNTTGVPLGKYYLMANTSEVVGDVYPPDNTYVDGIVTIASSNLVQFPISIGGHIFIVEVNSTSIAVNPSFSSDEKKMSFSLTGALGWFSNVTIPMGLLNASSPSAWVVKLNGTNIAYTAMSNGTHYFLYFDYAQSPEPYTVEIIGETAATPPSALFTPSKTTAMAGESITFDASASYDPDGTIESWTWSFNGETDTGEIVQHLFAAHGTYIVTLTVKDNEDLANSTQVTITITDYPIADFTYSPTEPLVDQTITFDATNSDPVGGTITEYSWKFGDDQTGTGNTVTHSYSTTGTFTVNLTVTDSEGLANSTIKTITVTIHDIALTTLTATPSTVRIGETVTIQLTVNNNGNFTESFTITAYYRDAATDVAIETRSITDLTSGDFQVLTVSWSTASVGPNTYTIKAETSAILGETRTEDNTLANVIVTVQKKISTLTIDASSETVTLGGNTNITGTLTPALASKTITLQYRLVGQSWTTLSTTTTDTLSNYKFTWTPTSTGTYEVQATWQGDANTETCQSNVQTITVKEAETQGIPIEYVAITLAAAIILVVVAVYLLRIRK